MFPLIRTLVYASLFIALVLVLVPALILDWSGVARPSAMGMAQWAGLGIVVLGGALALACVLTFATLGRGTPAPFDPPRRLVVQGPYRFVRNPMGLGAGTALAGAALYYGSVWLLAFTILFFTILHAFVRLYEEPTLRRMFGADYDAYCARVHRWLPGFSRRPTSTHSRAGDDSP